MRMPRLTIRRMMLVVAAVGIVVGISVEGRRLYHLSRYYRNRASEAAVAEATYSKLLPPHETYTHQLRVALQESLKKDGATPTDWNVKYLRLRLENAELDLKFVRACMARHQRLHRTYREAARHPWMKIPPDPPEPEAPPAEPPPPPPAMPSVPDQPMPMRIKPHGNPTSGRT